MVTTAWYEIPRIVRALAAHLPNCPERFLPVYAVLVTTRGERTTLEEVHDAWAAVEAVHEPDHPALVPFSALSAFQQEKDRKYRDVIAVVAYERENLWS